MAKFRFDVIFRRSYIRVLSEDLHNGQVVKGLGADSFNWIELSDKENRGHCLAQKGNKSMTQKRLIWFCYGMEEAAAQPDLLARLRDAIGLTTIMPESPVCHTSGFGVSQALAQRGPFEDWRERSDRWPRAAEGIYPPVAGIVSGFDDTPLLRLIEAAHGAGIEVWGHLGLWSYGGDVYPEYAMRDIDGRELDPRYEAWGNGLCPSRAAINDWTRDCLVEAAQRYDLDGFCLDHARYPAPAGLPSLFTCACVDCRRQAAELGYDVERLIEGLQVFRADLQRLDRRRLVSLLGARPSLWEFIGLCDGGAEVLEWLRLRATLLSVQMQRFRAAVEEVVGDKPFGSDVFPPSVALLGGHDYADWAGGANYLTGGSSFGGNVGWATMVTNLAGEWGAALCRTVADLAQGEALELTYRLFGYDDLGLPQTFDGLKRDPLPLAAMFAREVAKLKAVHTADMRLYPPLSLSAAPELVGQLVGAVADQQCDGAMLSFGTSEEAVERVVQLDLKALR